LRQRPGRRWSGTSAACRLPSRSKRLGEGVGPRNTTSPFAIRLALPPGTRALLSRSHHKAPRREGRSRRWTARLPGMFEAPRHQTDHPPLARPVRWPEGRLNAKAVISLLDAQYCASSGYEGTTRSGSPVRWVPDAAGVRGILSSDPFRKACAGPRTRR